MLKGTSDVVVWKHNTFDNNFEIKNYFQTIWGKIVGGVLINIFPSNISPTMLLLERFHRDCQAAFGCCEY